MLTLTLAPAFGRGLSIPTLGPRPFKRPSLIPPPLAGYNLHMTLDAMTRAEAEKLPVFEACSRHEIGAFYLWADFTDGEHTFFVRPAAVNDSECLADVFGIRDGIMKSLGREMFIRVGGRLRLLDE